eukprot:COSAG05_NODE_687_length_7922_cov_7.188035_9_plen_77_part_00
MCALQARRRAEHALQSEERRRQQAELRARETEWALEKAEQLLRAHEEASGFYIQKVRGRAAGRPMHGGWREIDPCM